MKIKTLNGLFAATAFSIMFANASIAANAEELPDEGAMVSEQEDSGRTGQQEETEGPVPEDEASSEQGDEARDKENGTQGEPGSDSVPDLNQEGVSLPESGVPIQDAAGETGKLPGEDTVGGQPAGTLNGEQSSGPANGAGTEENTGQEEGSFKEEQDPDQGGTAPAGADGGQSSELPGPDGEEEDGKTSGTENSGIQGSGPANFEEAEDNLDKAKEDEEQAKSELDQAQTEADAAQADADKALQEVQEAETELDQAQEKKEEAETQKNEADKAAAGAEQKVEAAGKELDDALQDANVSRDEFEKVQQDLEEKKAGQEAAQQTADKAEADYNDKKAGAEAAAAEAEAAGKNVESAKNDKTAADQAVADAQKKADSAKEAYDSVLNGAGTDTEAGNAASESLKKAREVLESVKKKIASGSLGFFQYLGEAGSDSAKVAALILTANNESGVPGVNNGSWVPDSWDEFTSYTSLGEENDATSLENMRKTIAFMKECNELRVADNNFPGLSALQVNDALMAIAQLNANWAAWTPEDKINTHSMVFNMGENLAWYYVDVPGRDDPFQGWYYEEKEIFDSKGNGDTGHYENITRAVFGATGFGINISQDSKGASRLNCSQEFSSDSNINYYGYGQCYSVEEYESRFMAYYNAVMKELSDAQAAYDAALAAYNQVTGGVDQELIDSKKAELDKATDNLEAAKVNAEEKLEILNNAQEVLADSMEKNASAQAACEQSRGKLETAKNDLQVKKEAYEAALKNIGDNFGTAVARAAESLMKYKAEYRQALAVRDKATAEFEEAEAVWTAAADRKAAADRNLEEKTAVLAQKLQVLQNAGNAYREALARLDAARADYDRLKPKEETSPESYGEEGAGYAEPVQANAVDVIDLSAIDSRKATFSKGCSFKYFLEYTMSFIRDSSFANLTIDCSNLPWYSFNKKILETLRGSLDRALTVVFRYKGHKYMFTIPSGFDLDLLQDSHGWYGFMYLKMIFGGYEVV